MKVHTSELERAFQLARSGKHVSVVEIRRQLLKEGYSNNQVSGRLLMAQLRSLIQAAQAGLNVRSDAP
jgi:hypothetical protein